MERTQNTLDLFKGVVLFPENGVQLQVKALYPDSHEIFHRYSALLCNVLECSHLYIV